LSLLLKIVNYWADRFDESKYPRDFYLETLSSISASQESEEVGRFVIRLLQWKDGKVQLDPNGKTTVNGTDYRVGISKPNTYDPKVHDSIFFSERFFTWAQEVKNLQVFSSDLLSKVRNQFGLWGKTSLVIPAFLLHILNPRVFPIFDQYVERARRFLTSRDLNISSGDLRIHDYAEYSLFWVELLSDLGINIETAEYGHVKRVDEALWAMGKYLKQPQKAKLPHCRGVNEILNTAVQYGRITTSSPEFKNAVLQHAGNMRQAEAMRQAAKELGVHLRDSYLKYPGAHIHRWRQQGFPK
jgi:hypothetical protein